MIHEHELYNIHIAADSTDRIYKNYWPCTLLIVEVWGISNSKEKIPSASPTHVVTVHYSSEHPAVPDNIDQPSHPKSPIYVVAEEFELVCFAQPERLCAHPNEDVQKYLSTRHGKLRNKKRKEECVP